MIRVMKRIISHFISEDVEKSSNHKLDRIFQALQGARNCLYDGQKVGRHHFFLPIVVDECNKVLEYGRNRVTRQHWR